MNSKDMIIQKDVEKKLGLNNFYQLQKILDIYGIKGISESKYGKVFYFNTDIKMLKKEIDERYTYNVDHMLTAKQIRDLGGNSHDIALFESFKAGPIDRVNEFKGATVLYNKKEVLNRINQKKKTTEFYTTKEAAYQLEFSNIKRNLAVHLKKFNIYPIKIPGKQSLLWEKSLIDVLVQKQQSLYQYYDENYHTLKEIDSISPYEFSEIRRVYKSLGMPIKYVYVPKEVKFNRFRYASKVLSKSELKILISRVDDYYLNLKCCKNKEIEQQTNIVKNEGLIKEEILNEIRKFTSLDPFIIYSELYNYSGVIALDKDVHIISIKDVERILNINSSSLRYVLNHNKIQSIRYQDIQFILIKPLKKLFQRYEKEQKLLTETNYSSQEVLQLTGNTHYLVTTTKSLIPEYLKFGRLKNIKFLFPKEVVNLKIQNKNRQTILDKYKTHLEKTTLYHQVFEQTLKDLNLNFTEDLSLTGDLWFKFVKKKLLDCKGNSTTLKKNFTRFITITEIFIKRLSKTEIFHLSDKEINITFFNSSTELSYKQEIYAFLNSLSGKNIKLNYSMKKVINPHEIKKRISNKNGLTKHYYSLETFISLLDYVSNVNLHKENILNDFKNLNENLKKYKASDSVWLFVILHLNNGWRAKDFIYTIPRVTIPSRITDILDYINNGLNQQECETIIFELTSKLIDITHSKNGKKNYFFCSKELIVPLANALVLCELRARMLTPLSPKLIHLSNKDELLTSSNNYFFKHFKIKSFKFKSLSMNRSFITFTNQVIKQKTNRNPMEITKFIRNHASVETTNKYVQIDEQHLNRISNELFDKGYFGYTYEFLLKSILEIDKPDILTKSIDYNIVKSIFGDIYKIENLATYISTMESNKLPLHDYVNKLKKNEIQEMMDLIHLEQLPAKEPFWQCILGDCLYMNKNCENCPFAVPHFYTLTSILKKLLRSLNDIENKTHQNYLGEKVKIANDLYKNLVLLRDAKKMFGENVISAFLGKEYKELVIRISNLEDIYQYLTIEKEGM